MRVDPKSSIAGIPALQVRDALRRLSTHETFGSGALARELKRSEAEAEIAIEELIRLKYLETSVEEENAYALTEAGRRFRGGSGTKPITRLAAARKLAAFLRRVEDVNGNADFVFRISEVLVFGSFLTGVAELSDVDVAISLEPRYDEAERRARYQARIEVAEAAGRRFGNMIDRLVWPQTEVKRALISGARSISLHEASELRQLECPSKEVFPRNELAADADLAPALEAAFSDR